MPLCYNNHALQVIHAEGRYILGSSGMSIGLAKRLPSCRVGLVVTEQVVSFETDQDGCKRYLQMSTGSTSEPDLFWAKEKSDDAFMVIVEVWHLPFLSSRSAKICSSG
jgi:hypothetical protein